MTDPVVPIPAENIPGGSTNPITVGPRWKAGGGGYCGPWVVFQKQWGPGAYNVDTGTLWHDIISCSEGASGYGGRYKAKLCDSHQGVSIISVAPTGFIIADNYLARVACNDGPMGQLYDARGAMPFFVLGFDLDPRTLRGFSGTKAYFGNGVLDMETGIVTSGPPKFPTVLDAQQISDPKGRVWDTSINPKGLKVISTGPIPTPTPAPTPTPTPTPTPKPTPTHGHGHDKKK
jgi:hypothetical protein